MSGSKIRSAVENVQNIFENHIQGQDSIMVMTFNGSAVTEIAMSLKSGNEEKIANKIASLIRPTGGTGERCFLYLNAIIRIESNLLEYLNMIASVLQCGRYLPEVSTKHPRCHRRLDRGAN
jgi:hypothetical protein